MQKKKLISKTPPKKQESKVFHYFNTISASIDLNHPCKEINLKLKSKYCRLIKLDLMMKQIQSDYQHLRQKILCLIELLDSALNERFFDPTIAQLSVRQLKEIIQDNKEILPLLKIDTIKLSLLSETLQIINQNNLIPDFEVLDYDLYQIIKILQFEEVKPLIKNDSIIQELLEENSSVSEGLLIKLYDNSEIWLKLVANQKLKIYPKELIQLITRCMTLRNGFWFAYSQIQNIPFAIEIYDKAKVDMLNLYNLEILNFIYKSIIMENGYYNQLTKDGNLFHLLNNRLQKQNFDEDLYCILKILHHYIVRFGIQPSIFDSGFMDSLSQQLGRSNNEKNFSKTLKIIKIIEFRLQNIEEYSKDIKWYFLLYEKLIHQSLDLNVAFDSTENLYQMLKNTNLRRYIHQFQQIFTLEFCDHLKTIENDIWTNIVKSIFQL